MIDGLAFPSGSLIYFQFLGGTPSQYLFGISPEGIGFVGMIINFSVTFVVSYLTPPPPAAVQAMVQDIHLPEDTEELDDFDPSV